MFTVYGKLACPRKDAIVPSTPSLSQVSRILGPIVSCLEQLGDHYNNEKDPHLKKLIDTGYGGLEKLRKDILFDFFRSAFDGSGADNFFDAGRCVFNVFEE